MTDEPVGGVRVCRVFLVDDHAVFRSGVRAELAGQAGIEVVGEAGSVAEAVAGIGRVRPDVVLLDVHMPEGGGVAVLRSVLGTDPSGGPATADTSGTSGASDAPVSTFLALSVSDAAEDVIAVIRGGARGYVTKTISGGELADAVRRVADGDAVFSPRLAGFVLDAFARAAPGLQERGEPVHDPEVDSLTPREKEVLRLLARGYTYKEIAETLFISVKTVETHASNVLRKTQQSNRHALTRWAQSRHLD
ncbi:MULTISPECIES: response regulator transcription factor [unclassified Dietzia]|uniref:LuxR C-terminal-related transcriptional regulator n=4 Tax=Dietzia TaxID=37914 RepID=UPI000D217624|nr:MULTISPECIES: response regulator transcription factor [unclassified Dietzia]AVZ38803.1 DNA-binding response regulator [Dietzia sp. JS16-p6b]QGW23909.1 two component transcriptional regulator, LuxR family protein [Dietzia sp. DQ12-45-1b]